MPDPREVPESDVPDKLAVRPPPEEEDAPPGYANQVRVYGGTDAVVIEFYYVNHAKYFDGLRGRFTSENMSREGDTLHLRVRPVARVAIPLSTAAELVVNMMTMVVGGLPELQRSFGDWGERIGALMTDAQTFLAKVTARQK